MPGSIGLLDRMGDQMLMKRMSVILFVIILALTAGIQQAAGTETGSPSAGQCFPYRNVVCGWTSTNLRGGFHPYRYSVGNAPGIRSLWNKRPDWIVIYSGRNYTGSRVTVPASVRMSATPFPVRSIGM